MSKSLMSLTALAILIAASSFCPTFCFVNRRTTSTQPVRQAPVQQNVTSGLEAQIRQQPYAIVKLTASWCTPCQAVVPILQQAITELRTETGKTIAVFSVDIDQDPYAKQFSFSSVPTFCFMQNGSLKGQQSGAPADVASMKRLIRSNLSL